MSTAKVASAIAPVLIRAAATCRHLRADRTPAAFDIQLFMWPAVTLDNGEDLFQPGTMVRICGEAAAMIFDGRLARQGARSV